jgi:hypothetical protein
MGNASSAVLDSIAENSNCAPWPPILARVPRSDPCLVDRDEVDRLRKRFMKLDKVCPAFLRGWDEPSVADALL